MSSALMNNRNGRCSVTFHKGYKLFAGVRMDGNKAVLRGPGSDVQLHIPEGFHGFISGHAHTDPIPFLKAIPKTECLVSPIVEYDCTFTSKCRKRLFEIKVPHCVRNRKQFQHIRVWHGDIRKKSPFTKHTNYRVHDQHLTIYTSHFSQFICTVCSQSCHGNAKAFIFGRITPLRYHPIKSALRIYMCSPLYDITDFKRVSKPTFYSLTAGNQLFCESVFGWVASDSEFNRLKFTKNWGTWLRIEPRSLV